MRIRSLTLGFCLATMFAALGAVPALAAQDPSNFGFADVNAPGHPTAPAFSGTLPGNKAIWTGTCDLTSGSTANGGVGSAPVTRAHCIDIGGSSLGSTGSKSPWPPGQEPTWRLDPVIQAGAHPDATATFFFNYSGDSNGTDGNVKNIIVKLPPGVVGNPEATPKCSALAAQAVPPACPPETQTGISTIGFTSLLPLAPSDFMNFPVYTIEARDTVTAEFSIGYVAGLFNVPITARGRTNSDYGVDTLALLVPNIIPIGGQAFTFWGVPWAAEHDKLRIDGSTLPETGSVPLHNAHKNGWPLNLRRPYQPSWGPIKPFFTNPTECTGKRLPLTVEVDSWQNPVARGGEYVSATVETDVLEGCDLLEFDPTVTLRPTVEVADSPSGIDVKLSIPQNNDPPAEIPGNANLAHDPADDTGAPAYWRTPAGLATAHLKDTTVHLPRGTSFNPAAANGLRGCTSAQVGLTATFPKVTFNNDPITCPDTAKIGTLKIVSPLLPDPLEGDVYAAPQHDNPFPGSLTAIYLIAQDHERGLSIKLAGKVDLDPDTGQIATTFVDNPQLPFDYFELHFKTGPRAPLNTPPVCGQYENAADLIPWSFPSSGPQPTIRDPFPISQMPNGLACVGQPEDRVFRPGFQAGSTSNAAASFTNFALTITREDGEQEISGLSIDMPPGVTAKLAETPYCPEASIAAARTRTGLEETNSSSCPPASYVGRVDTMAGAGTVPLPTTGKVYLSGPYDPDGAGPKPVSPLSVTTVVPAIAGGVPGNPAFDLGNVVIRTAINVDPQTAQVHIDSTDVPYIVGGVPLRIRKINISLDKPGFMLNPTNCAPLAVEAGLNGAADPFDRADDVLVRAASRFQVDGCQALPFKPKLQLRIKGGIKRNDYQRLTATLTPRPGDANLKSISVAMPHALFLAQNHINTVCTRVQFAANQCPPGSIYGHAEATTPLLKDPLAGPVYLRSSSNLLPDLVIGLRGQVGLDVVGRVDSFNEGLRNSFEVAPDAPVSRFTLKLRGGNKSLLVNSQNICTKGKLVKKKVNGVVKKVRKRVPITIRATVKYEAHNGIAYTRKVPLERPACGKKGKKAKKGSGKTKQRKPGKG